MDVADEGIAAEKQVRRDARDDRSVREQDGHEAGGADRRHGRSDGRGATGYPYTEGEDEGEEAEDQGCSAKNQAE